MARIKASKIKTVKSRKSPKDYTAEELSRIVWAFLSVLLAKIDGVVALSFDMLDKFPDSEMPSFEYNSEIDGLVLTHPMKKKIQKMLTDKKNQIIGGKPKVINPFDLVSIQKEN